MNSLWNVIRNTMAIVGFICIVGAIGTSDMCVEMGCVEPPVVWDQMLVGFLLMIPGIIHMVRVTRKDSE